MEDSTFEAKHQIDIAARSAQLRAIARGYVTEGIGKNNFDAIPYTDNVVLRAPIAPGGSVQFVKGRENLRSQWWTLLDNLLGEVKVFDCFVNQELTAVAVEFHVGVAEPPCTLRITTRFKIDAGGEIIDQEDFFDPQVAINLGWTTG